MEQRSAVVIDSKAITVTTATAATTAESSCFKVMLIADAASRGGLELEGNPPFRDLPSANKKCFQIQVP